MESKENASNYLTVEEAAELVGLSHWTIRLWLQKRRLTRYKCGSRTVVSRLELLELVKPVPANVAQVRELTLRV